MKQEDMPILFQTLNGGKTLQENNSEQAYDLLAISIARPNPYGKAVVFSYGIRLVTTLVDPKGIEPSNLTDANRALSQLSYGPIYCLVRGILYHTHTKSKYHICRLLELGGPEIFIDYSSDILYDKVKQPAGY